MHRVFWFKVGGKRMHLLKLAGAFFVLASVLKVAEAAYDIFVVVNKANMAGMRPELISSLFGWGIGAPYNFSGEDVLGVLLGPVASFLFWLGIALVALMVYQSGKLVFPVEEYEQKMSAHHRKLIETAIRKIKKKR
ncbi:hypothetical protein COX85_01055 [Candidatus Micrarchaeota archaeon CG_4_10_14_0_2_um_filter_55_9]|nr:MAG: hypothetical protein AUJ15_02035 [Candidatus Micrarchaeota archaeon CG1_02_55_41]PIO03458.1 MAG: hypothetical protein COT57_00710 [Candidatus Micrarchaeota archaeon CG09_land_8_20_14_0_10_55_25]PIZ91967.1 MAG: hypothetical protein COX85_01055 [Candidatus Micrarchaeota archaeon CG_4_10_14_0_2_um_filter_55_9]PJD00982.1 MAG: hypothetical protein COU38_03455 [Candidatus Micrarchaeota archaeon CG10_big_fil_rev_8_21_14_0_10_54_18]